MCATNSTLNGACLQNLDTTNSVQARVCCGGCLKPKSGKKIPFWVWIIVAIGALLVLGIIGTIVYCMCCSRQPQPPIPDIYPGRDGNGLNVVPGGNGTQPTIPDTFPGRDGDGPNMVNGGGQFDPPYSPPKYKGHD